MTEARQRRLRGAQAASLLFAAACREHSGDVVSQSSRGFFTTRRRGVRQAAGRSRLAACAPRNIVAAFSLYCAYRANPVQNSCCEEKVGRHRRNSRAVDGGPAHRDRWGEFSGLQSYVGLHQRTREHGRVARATGELGGLFPGGSVHERVCPSCLASVAAFRRRHSGLSRAVFLCGRLFGRGVFSLRRRLPFSPSGLFASDAQLLWVGWLPDCAAQFVGAGLGGAALAAGGFFVGLRMGGRC